jgi:serine/threonine protein kinase/tetratricopeptide (TPR) repeat protein
MICAHCHTPNPTNADRCSRCGSGLNLDAQAAETAYGATIEVSDSASILTGADFGPRYHVEALLGSGGMGKVYKARDRELERTVALKVLRPDMMTDAEALQRFKHELLLASSISHPNILRIHDLGEYNGVKFISMAYVDGGDLTQLLKKEGRLPLDRTLNIIRQLAAALAAAHSAHVVHRDLKPQNILLDKDDRVYVSDFGIAKTLESDRTSVTRTGAVIGTPLYMSPEQVEGKPVDHRSDLYTFGLILYQMLTGVLPFSGDTTLQLMYQRVHQVPKRPELVAPDLPPYLSRICLKCLEKEPAKRYQSANEIVTDFEFKHAPDSTRTVQITLPVLSWKGWALSGGAVVLLLGGLLALPPVRDFLFRHKPTEVTSGIPSLKQGKYVAVLPMKVFGDQNSLGYVADGMGEALSAKLFQLHDIHTASATEVQKLRPSNSLEEAARQLGVNLIVSGTIQGSGDKLRITASLDNVATGHLVWKEEFSGVQQDLLTLEDQIYGKLVEALALRPSNEENQRASSHPTENIEAYDLYLKGRDSLRNQQDLKNVQSAITFFEQATQKDRAFPLAYAGIADASLVMYRETKNSFWSAKALAAAQQARALNQNQPEILLALGSVYNATGRTAEAIAELKQALQVAPNSDEAYGRIGSAYLGSGRSSEGLAALKKAVEINPYYWVNYNTLGNAYYELGDFSSAADSYRKVIELDPNNPYAYNNLGAVLLQIGRFQEAVEPLQKSLQTDPEGQAYSNVGIAYFYLKQYDKAIANYEKAVQLVPDSDMFVGNLAEAYALAGQKERANTTFERAIALAYKGLQVNPRSAGIKGRLALWYGKKGDAKQALKFIAEARAIDPNDLDLIYYQAQAQALSGDKAAAIETLGTAFKKGQSTAIAQAEPDLQSLREDPRFKSLVREFTKPQ